MRKAKRVGECKDWKPHHESKPEVIASARNLHGSHVIGWKVQD